MKFNSMKCKILFIFNIGGPDVVFDFGDFVMSSADKTIHMRIL